MRTIGAALGGQKKGSLPNLAEETYLVRLGLAHRVPVSGWLRISEQGVLAPGKIFRAASQLCLARMIGNAWNLRLKCIWGGCLA